ncbi:hypothetical protein PCANC_17579 [Puccinia coronata f. sp. avenae]|uniref:RxLR effector protein n=1 Tax=Puccinia coronata f. sp. avenae TaxID=200324 RepID=A0A2N5VN35_9BASI|nr:hypothetical protein PCANC_17579 [Puccinia coronata f. sp. avenae]
MLLQSLLSLCLLSIPVCSAGTPSTLMTEIVKDSASGSGTPIRETSTELPRVESNNESFPGMEATLTADKEIEIQSSRELESSNEGKHQLGDILENPENKIKRKLNEECSVLFEIYHKTIMENRKVWKTKQKMNTKICSKMLWKLQKK